MQRLVATTLIIMAALLSGCGFALRGTAALPVELQTLYLESLDPGTEILREMRRVLQNNQITLLQAPAAESYRLGIGEEQNTERALSVNANARAGEYELTMSLPFQLRQGGTILLGPETLQTSKVYLADPENAVAKNEEAQQIRSEMRRELAQQIIRRLEAVSP
jgi:LPS-assembly lipoprotein